MADRVHSMAHSSLARLGDDAHSIQRLPTFGRLRRTAPVVAFGPAATCSQSERTCTLARSGPCPTLSTLIMDRAAQSPEVAQLCEPTFEQGMVLRPVRNSRTGCCVHAAEIPLLAITHITETRFTEPSALPGWPYYQVLGPGLVAI